MTADFSRWTFRRRLRKSQFSTTQKSDFCIAAIFGGKRAYFAPPQSMKKDFQLSKNRTAVTKENAPGSARIAPQ